MTRRKLIFFTNTDPAVDPSRVQQAYHFATVAARAGLKAEVRLAGDAVKVAVPGAIAGTEAGEDLTGKIRLGTAPGYVVSL